jgi:DNA (cytosine-5)-methyltransferase 1
MKAMSLFSGIGGLDRGLERAGIEVAVQVEVDEYRRQVLARHWPAARRFSDVHEITPRLVGESFDLIFGGDPCQENSNARTSGLRAPSLGSEFVRVVEEFRPRCVLRENPYPVRADAPWPWHRFRSELERLGYGVVPFRLRACCVGAHHRRDRLFLLAALPDTGGAGLQRHERSELEESNGWQRPDADATGPTGRHPPPRICGAADGISNRKQRLAGLGDAVDIRVGEYIGRMIMEGEAMRPAEGVT